MQDIEYWRDAHGLFQTSLPRSHVHHSPTGFEVGVAGSGPADFALNILALALPVRGACQTERLWDGTRVSIEAWSLAQRFKEEVIAALPRDQGTIAAADVAAWLAQQTPRPPRRGGEDGTTRS